jgi:hypothetical protein
MRGSSGCCNRPVTAVGSGRQTGLALGASMEAYFLLEQPSYRTFLRLAWLNTAEQYLDSSIASPVNWRGLSFLGTLDGGLGGGLGGDFLCSSHKTTAIFCGGIETALGASTIGARRPVLRRLDKTWLAAQSDRWNPAWRLFCICRGSCCREIQPTWTRASRTRRERSPLHGFARIRSPSRSLPAVAIGPQRRKLTT